MKNIRFILTILLPYRKSQCSHALNKPYMFATHQWQKSGMIYIPTALWIAFASQYGIKRTKFRPLFSKNVYCIFANWLRAFSPNILAAKYNISRKDPLSPRPTAYEKYYLAPVCKSRSHSASKTTTEAKDFLIICSDSYFIELYLNQNSLIIIRWFFSVPKQGMFQGSQWPLNHQSKTHAR